MAIRPRHQLETHTVHNQPAPRGDRDLWAEDVALRAAVSREGALKHSDVIARYGETLGRAEMREQGRLANRYLPELSGFDSSGRRIDEVTFHPSYHALMAAGISAGYSSIAWEADAGGHVGHAALVYLTSQVEPGVCCPMTMTYAAIPAL